MLHLAGPGQPRLKFRSAVASVISVAVVFIALPAQAQDAPTPVPPADAVERVMKLEDPMSDDWLTEIYYKKANKQLGKLAARLAELTDPSEADPAEFFTADASFWWFQEEPVVRHFEVNCVGVREQEPRSIHEDDAYLQKPESTDKPMDVAKLWFYLLQGKPGGRFAFKIVSVRALSEGTFALEVLAQAYRHHNQTNARWQMTWVLEKPEDPESYPRIRTIVQRDFTLSASDRFADATRAIIRDDATWHPYLSRGANYWHGRIDAVGELNFLGHEGIAIGDVNGDGLDDVYVALGNGVPNKLLIQQPDGTVTDTAAAAGVDWLDSTKGVLLVDIDNDGDQDLLTAMGPAVVVHKNDGKGRFEVTKALRATTPAAFYSLAAADYDLDGDLDIYAVRYVKVRYGLTSAPMPLHDANNGPRNHLLRNDGEAGFADVTVEVGLDVNNSRFSTAAAWGDYDNDGDPDLYVTNDFGRNNLYRNDAGRFTDVAAEVGVEDQAAGMGASWGDYDNDGDLDLYVSNMFSSAGRRVAYQSRFLKDQPDSVREGVQRHSLGNTLLVNNGKGGFDDRSDAAGVRMGRWAWGAKFVDLNNDGYEDIFVPNGFLTNALKDDL
jgi:hypothetical protein